MQGIMISPCLTVPHIVHRLVPCIVPDALDKVIAASCCGGIWYGPQELLLGAHVEHVQNIMLPCRAHPFLPAAACQ